jgi:Carboxypeptidase regulatory-like domain
MGWRLNAEGPMLRCFITSSLFICLALCVPALAQTKSSSDPTNRPAPMYSKSRKKEDLRFRSVHGIVKDEKENPVNGALVNLTNLKSKKTLTYITKADGTYYFDDLSRDEDYQLDAVFHEKKTQTKKLSHYDPQRSSMRILTFGEPEEQAVSTTAK